MIVRFVFLHLIALALPWVSAHGQETATYQVTIDVTWSAATHPLDFPATPTFSHLVGATHSERYAMFRDGETGSSGLELIAERGRVSIFLIELEEAGDRELIGTVFEGDEIEEIPGKGTLSFSATADFPLLSFVTMIAPSPDWFTGVAGVELHDGNQWIDQLTLPLWVWDAGTDSGDTYFARNLDTQPQQSVRLLATPHFLTNRGLLKVGDVKIARLD